MTERRAPGPVAKVLARVQVTLPREVRRRACIKLDDLMNIEVLGPGRLHFTSLPSLSPRQLRERFPIDAQIDEAANRANWQAESANEVIGR